jgi:hypothetical protein
VLVAVAITVIVQHLAVWVREAAVEESAARLRAPWRFVILQLPATLQVVAGIFALVSAEAALAVGAGVCIALVAP